MDNIRPWQIILFIAAIGVLGFSAWKFGFGSSIEGQMADSMMMVDVQTGQLYEVDVSGQRGVLIPARHPETNEVALLPVFDEGGEWFLYERYRPSLSSMDVSLDAIAGADQAVKVNGEKPIRYKKK